VVGGGEDSARREVPPRGEFSDSAIPESRRGRATCFRVLPL